MACRTGNSFAVLRKGGALEWYFSRGTEGFGGLSPFRPVKFRTDRFEQHFPAGGRESLLLVRFQKGGEARGIFHVEYAGAPVDAAHEAPQNLLRPHFDELGIAFLDEPLHRLLQRTGCRYWLMSFPGASAALFSGWASTLLITMTPGS